MTKPTENTHHIDFDRGELVRVRMTPEVVGQVIGEKDWGKSFLIRYGGAEEMCWYENIELETFVKADAKANAGSDEEPPKSNRKMPAKVNVVQFADYRRAKGGVH